MTSESGDQADFPARTMEPLIRMAGIRGVHGLEQRGSISLKAVEQRGGRGVKAVVGRRQFLGGHPPTPPVSAKFLC